MTAIQLSSKLLKISDRGQTKRFLGTQEILETISRLLNTNDQLQSAHLKVLKTI